MFEGHLTVVLQLRLSYNPQMFNHATLNTIHAQTHVGTAKLLEHCVRFSPEELSRKHEVFGYASLTELLRHIIGTEDYWISVLKGNWDIEDHAAACNNVAELEERRAFVARQTTEHFAQLSETELNTLETYATWPDGNQRELLPAFVMLRVVTHSFHHRGQAATMCRLLGQPAPSMDFPVAPG